MTPIFRTDEAKTTIILDVESTGTDPVADRILELALLEAVRELGGGFARQRIRVQRYDPGVLIPEEAAAVHGIRLEDVAGAHHFGVSVQHFRGLDPL